KDTPTRHRCWRSGRAGPGQVVPAPPGLHLLLPERFDDVADFEVVEALDGDTALVPGVHLADVLLEPAQRRDPPLEQGAALAQDTDGVIAGNGAICDVAAGRLPAA